VNNKDTRARQLFDQIISNDDPAAFLRKMIDDKRCEIDYLEFKGASRIQEKEAKHYWSKALSGFANTEGGVIIWGISAHQITNPDDPSRKIDAADSLDLVPNPKSFSQLLRDVKLEATVRPVVGVEYKDYVADKGDGSGFVLCLIPEGTNKPYRAELDPKKQYYQRVGDSFIVIPHSMLASLFYPRATPKLQVEISPTKEEQIDNSRPVRDRQSKHTFEVYLKNSGTGSGYDILVSFQTNYSSKVSVRECFSPANRPRKIKKYLANRPIHPDESIHCFTFSVEAPTDLNFQEGAHNSVRNPRQIDFQVGIYARDTIPVESVIMFNETDIDNRTAKSTENN
jgi:hypothetical protein